MWKEILEGIAQRSARDGSLPEATQKLLRDLWPALVGKSIARFSTPTKLRGGTLHIDVRQQALMEDWQRSPRPLLNRIRRFSPWPIEELACTHNPNAGVLDASTEDIEAPNLERPSAPTQDSSPPPGIDSELLSLIQSIEAHRNQSEQ